MDDFYRLNEEKSTQIRDLKASKVGLKAEFQAQQGTLAEMQRRLADAESRAKGGQFFSEKDANLYISILIECCYR